MLDAERWAEARRLRHAEGLSIGQIARTLKLDRKTVRKAIAQATWPGLTPKSPKPRGSIVDPYRDVVRRYLDENGQLTAVQVLDRLRREDHFVGKISVVRKLVRSLRKAEADAFLRLTHLPGKVAQVDWGSCGSVRVGGALRRLSIFVMVLAHSRYLYAEYTLSERMDAFLEAHVRAFAFFGGVPSRVVYDNCKTVTLDRRCGEVRFHPRLLEFAGHYLFQPRPCPPRRPWHKGIVESAIGYVRKSLLSARTGTVDLDRDRAELARWIRETANVRIHRETGKRPVDLFGEVEHGLLLPLPPHPYDAAHVEPASANRFFEVHFDGNRYTVPFRYAHRTGLLVRATTIEVVILEGMTEIARHRRSYDRGQRIEDPEHVRGLLERKRRAERDTLMGRLAVILGDKTKDYVAGLVRTGGRNERHIERILRLADLYGADELRATIDHAMEFGAFGADYVENILAQRRRAKGAPPLLPIDAPAAFGGIHLAEPDFSWYERLAECGAERSHDDRTDTDPDAEGPAPVLGGKPPLPRPDAGPGVLRGAGGAGREG